MKKPKHCPRGLCISPKMKSQKSSRRDEHSKIDVMPKIADQKGA